MFRADQPIANDLDMWFRIAYQWPKIGFISKPIAIYHMTIPGSISQKNKRWKILRELVERHLELAAEHDRLEAFEFHAARMVKSWIRSMIFENRPEEVNQLINRFGGLLTKHFKMFVRILMVSPTTTANLCHMSSRIVRALNLRRQIIRRPPKHHSDRR